MSTNAPGRPQIDKGKRTFQIVASQFNPQYVQGLVDHAAKELRELARKENNNAIIACGVILRGETNHAKNLSRSVTDALQRIAVDYGRPVVNVVLSFDNEDQARERCLESRINRGTEAARTAVEIARVMSELRRE